MYRMIKKNKKNTESGLDKIPYKIHLQAAWFWPQEEKSIDRQDWD